LLQNGGSALRSSLAGDVLWEDWGPAPIDPSHLNFQGANGYANTG